MKKQYSDIQICCFLFGITFLMMVVLGGLLNISYILDETGTVANAAYLAGYNWNDWVQSTGGYFYKYGQAFLWFPAFKLFHNPYILYKALLIINGFFVALIPVFVYKILRKHLNVERQSLCCLLSLTVAVIPASVLYSLFARAEAALIAFTWVIIYLILEVMEEPQTDNKRKQYILSALIALFSVYMYMCHIRGIVFVIATFMTVFVLRFVMKNKSFSMSIYIVSLIVWLFVDKQLTHYFKSRIWVGGAKKNTVEGTDFGKYLNIFSVDGIKGLIKLITGWFLNSFSGTYGLVTLGVVFSCVGIVYYLRKKKNVTGKEFVIILYSLLVFLGSGALGVLSFFGKAYAAEIAGYVRKRADAFVYTRYLSPAYALLVLVALYYLFVKTDCFGLKTKLAALGLGGVLILYCRTWLNAYTEKVEFSWRNAIDTAMFFDTVRYGNDASKYHGVSRALLIMAAVACVVLLLLVILSYKRVRYRRCIVTLVGMLFLLSLGVNYVKLRLATDVRPMTSVGGAITKMDEILENTELPDEYKEVYVDKSIKRYKMLQMAIPECTVHVRKSMKDKTIDNMFIIAGNCKVNELWMGEDCYLFADYDYENTKSTVIVKGEELKEELEAQGFILEKISEDYTTRKHDERNSIPFKEALKKSFGYQIESFGW